MKVFCQLTGKDGNAFAVMGRVKQAMANAKLPKEKIDAYFAEAMAGDYDDLLTASMKHLDDNGIDWS